MSKRRHCGAVIVEMIQHIPHTETEFRKALKWNYDDSLYKAPEETLQWCRTMETLEKYIPTPKEDWEYAVLSIFTTKSREELEIMIKKHTEQQNNGNQNPTD